MRLLLSKMTMVMATVLTMSMTMAITFSSAILLSGELAHSHCGVKAKAGAIAGPQDAVVTIEEFVDFYCPFCAQGSDTMKEVLNHYPNKVKLILRNTPLSSHNPGALIAAKAFNAVYMQSPLIANAYQAELFDNQDRLRNEGESFLFETADRLGVDVSKMKTDMASEQVAKMIEYDRQIANSHQFQGTPGYLVGSEKVVGARSFDEFKQIIDKQIIDKQLNK